MTVPFLVSGWFTYQKYMKDSEVSITSYSNQIVNQINLNLDRYIKEMERVTLAPLYDLNVMDILDAHSHSISTDVFLPTNEQFKMTLFMSSLQYDRSEIRGIVMFMNDGGIFSSSGNMTYTTWRAEQNEWMNDVYSEDGGLAILPPHEVEYYISGKQTFVSIARLIREPITNRKLGIIKVDLNAVGMERILTPFNLGIDSKLFVSDKQGRSLFPFTGSDGPNWQDPKLLTTSVRSDYSELLVIGQVPMAELRKNAANLTKFTLLISLISLSVAYLLAVWASTRLIRPLMELRRKMKEVQSGSFSVRAKVSTRDEIGFVTESFNRMVSQLERLVKEVYEVRIREKEAQLSALQSQMNPHFLYNTLESISMLAIHNDQLYLSSTVANLGKLLRYTVDNRQTKVLLQDEIRFVQAYIQIQTMRLGDKFKTEIYVDPSLQIALIPKLLIQPLIENAIEHGMGEQPMSIRIHADVDGNRLRLIIEDNGKGMSETTARSVISHMKSGLNDLTQESFGMKRKGYALRNSHQRIRLLYGNQFGIQINNRLSAGVRFTITIPLEWRLDE